MAKLSGRINRKEIEIPFKGPVSFPDIATARANLHAPADANYVTWNPSWPVNRDLEDVFNSLSANDILVLPERAQPYVLDSSEGFRASGVKSVTGRNGQVPIVSTYKGIRNARTWFAIARARRGILGLGPNARIEISNSGWTQEPQIQDAGSVQPDGWTSPGRYWTDNNNQVRAELVGCQEKAIEAEHSDSYFGNFTMVGRDLGGVAYSGLTSAKTFERLNLTAGWRGFLGVPNGESGAIGAGGSGYLISKCIIGTRDASGVRVGSSPIMVNSSSGGTIEDTDAGESFAGMMTLWNCSGKHYINNVNCRFNFGPGLNLEKTRAGFEVIWTGGSIWSDYYGGGGKSPKPADQSNNGRLHVGLHATETSAKITFRDVDIDTGPVPGRLNVQTYGSGTATLQQVSDVKFYDKDGVQVTPKLHGIN